MQVMTECHLIDMQVMTDEEKAEEREETGWKLVHADVFRPPVEFPMLFCVFVGTGTQLFISAFFFIAFAAVGFLSPANRGSIMIGMLLLFVLLGAVAGFTSARFYKTFKVMSPCMFFIFCIEIFHRANNGKNAPFSQQRFSLELCSPCFSDWTCWFGHMDRQELFLFSL